MENDPKFNVAFSLESEISRLTYTLEKIDWYKEQGYYPQNVRLPLGVDEKSNLDEAVKALQNEYEDSDYNNASKSIETELKVFPFKNLESLRSFETKDKCTILLTKYGTGGSYDYKNAEIIINIALRSKEQIISTVVHEFVHIGIQKYIDDYKIGHWQKERLVDLIVEKSFPGLRKMQNIKEPVDVVDSSFHQHYPDIREICRGISTSL